MIRGSGKVQIATVIDRVEDLHAAVGDNAAEVLVDVAIKEQCREPGDLLKLIKDTIRRKLLR
jgi:hypothetical protein